MRDRGPRVASLHASILALPKILALFNILAVVAGLAVSPAAAQERPAAAPGWGATVAPTRPAARAPTPVPAPDVPAPDVPALRRAADEPDTEAAAQPHIRAHAYSLSGDQRRTRFSLEVSARTRFTVSKLASPYRIVVDLDDVAFALPPEAGRRRQGLVQAFRYGLFAPGKSRIVIDTVGPVRIEAARFIVAAAGPQLVLDLVATTPTDYAAEEIAAAARGLAPRADAATPAPAAKPATRSKPRDTPVIVVDAGHGGIDPGAEGHTTMEKTVVLAVAREIQKVLLAGRRYKVVMTRTSDVFVSLEQRVRLSQTHGADLFLSVHADSLSERNLAASIRGATLYVLSERASDQLSRRRAQKENAVDLLAGLPVAADIGDDQVRHILLDLMRREAATLSSRFQGLLIRQLRPRLALSREPARSAPFKVLRQPGAPAVLVELGYISNIEDERLMASPAWQRGVAEGIGTAIDQFFQAKGRR